MIQVLLVDDHEVVRAGYRRLLENTPDIQVIAEATDGEEAYRAFAQYRPQVVIMDLSMPGIGGLEAIKKIKCQDKEARILVFSMHESDVFLERALREGVLGYITKRSAAKVMVEAVRQVALGKVFIGHEMQFHLARRGNNPADLEKPSSSEERKDRPSFNKLSPREFEVLLLLAEGKTLTEITDLLAKRQDHPLLNKLSQREFGVFLLLANGKTVIEIANLLKRSPKTIGHHYTKIKEKLNVSNTAELTLLAVREELITL